MALDYSKLTDEQLQAIADKDYSKLPDDVLLHLADEHDVSENKNVQLSEEALAARNDPLNTALAGAIAGGAAGVSSKGIKLVKALENLAPEKGLVEPVAPTAPPKEYFAPGEKYSAKTGYGSGPGQSVEEVVEHKKAQQAPLGSGKITSKMKGPFSPDEILAAAAQREADDKMRARVLAQEKLLHDQAQAEYAAKQQEYLKQKNALAQEKKFGLPNKLGTTKAITGATLGYNAMDVANQLKQDDYGQAALAGTGMLGAAAPYIKKLPPKYRAIGTSLSLLAPAINRGVDVVEQKAVGGEVQNFAGGKIVRSGLTELMELIKQRGGSEAAKRLERAADSVPNLEHQYQPQALQRAFTGDNAQAVMVMNPKDFEKYAAPIDTGYKSSVMQTYGIGDPEKYGGYNAMPKGTYQDYLDYLGKFTRPSGGGLSDVPYLQLGQELNSSFPAVLGHEGRHRTAALEKLGDQSTLVRMMPRAALREPFPRRSQEEYLKALTEQIGQKPFVKPQVFMDDAGKDVRRGLIELPEMFKNGGDVQHYATGGSLQDMGSAFGGAYPGALTMGGSMAPVDPVATPNPQDVVAMTPETPMTQNPNGSWSPTVNPTGPVNYSPPTPATGGGLSSLIPAKPVVNPPVPKPVIQPPVNPIANPMVAQAVRPRIKGATPSGFFNLRKGFHLR